MSVLVVIVIFTITIEAGNTRYLVVAGKTWAWGS